MEITAHASIARCDWLLGMQDGEMDLTSAAGVRDMHGGYLGISRDILGGVHTNAFKSTSWDRRWGWFPTDYPPIPLNP